MNKDGAFIRLLRVVTEQHRTSLCLTRLNQNYDHQDHVDGPVVSSHIITRKYRLDSAVKVDDPKVSPNQLQPSVGGDVLRCKFDVQKALAWKKKIGSTQSHLEWPPLQGGLVGVATALSPATCRPFQVFSPSFFVGLELIAPILPTDQLRRATPPEVKGSVGSHPSECHPTPKYASLLDLGCSRFLHRRRSENIGATLR